MDSARVRDSLRSRGLRAKKSLGQHFLTDRRVLGKILAAAGLGPEDVVVEVGPGLGILTRELAKAADLVIAVELDSNLASLLRREMAHISNVVIVEADILALEPGELLRRHCPAESMGAGPSVEYKVAANLPFYVASPAIRHFLEADQRPAKMVVMVQKEVGEAMTATPGDMGLLSLAVQIYGRPSIVARVPAHSFYPRPKVDSIVIAIDVYPEPLTRDPERLFKMARAGFSAPRKQLHNSLAHGLGLDVGVVRETLERVGIDGKRRPSTLTLEEWEALCWAFP